MRPAASIGRVMRNSGRFRPVSTQKPVGWTAADQEAAKANLGAACHQWSKLEAALDEGVARLIARERAADAKLLGMFAGLVVASAAFVNACYGDRIRAQAVPVSTIGAPAPAAQ